MLQSPRHAIVGTTDLDRFCPLLERFGFEVRARAKLPMEAAKALYGLEGGAREALLEVSGAEAGGLRAIETPQGPRPHGPYDSRPVAVDLYTRDIERSMRMAEEEGLGLGKLVSYQVGELTLQEVEAESADGLRLVFIQIDQRRPSVLDRSPERLHSEVHSIVFSVPSAQAAVDLWRGAGLEVLVDAPIGGPVLSQLMDLPKEEVPVRFVLMCDAAANPARFEVIEFTDERGEILSTWPLAGGLFGAAFDVQDLEAARRSLPGCDFNEPLEVGGAIHGGRTVLAGRDPSGLRFELWR